MENYKIAFHARHLADPGMRGLNRYSINLLEGLMKKGVEIFLYTDRPIHQNFLSRLNLKNINVRQSKPMQYLLWEQFWVPQQCKKDKIDIYHSPLNYGLPLVAPCLKVLTVHDAIYQVFERPLYPWYQKWSIKGIQPWLHHNIAIKAADKIITVSQFSKQDLVEKLKIPSNKISVIYEAAESLFSSEADPGVTLKTKEKFKLNRPYFFYVGGFEKRKNVLFILKALADSKIKSCDVVLAGENKNYAEQIINFAKSLNILAQVKLIGRVADEELLCLYQNALAFIYPSFYEGFGLQLCEAMSAGCPVLAAQTSCLPEILGNGGKTFSLDSTAELVTLMNKLSAEKEFGETLSKLSKSRSLDFSWDKAVVQTLEVYKNLLNSKP